MTNPAVNSRYDTTSQFATCPAATGESQCTHFPDRSHRCGEPRNHIATDTQPADERVHRCTCGETWTSLMGSFKDLFNLFQEAPTDA